jgi:signal transduction histidine kinase
VGLGLSIVSKIMDGHHGYIRVAEAVSGDGSQGNGSQGKGACFVLYFPAASEQDAVESTTHQMIS